MRRRACAALTGAVSAEIKNRRADSIPDDSYPVKSNSPLEPASIANAQALSQRSRVKENWLGLFHLVPAFASHQRQLADHRRPAERRRSTQRAPRAQSTLDLEHFWASAAGPPPPRALIICIRKSSKFNGLACRDRRPSRDGGARRAAPDSTRVPPAFRRNHWPLCLGFRTPLSNKQEFASK